MNDGARYMPWDTEVGCIPPERMMTTPALELLQEMVDGKLPAPPIARLLNYKLTRVADGLAEFRGVPLFDHYNPAGVVHGGWASTLLDSALGCAVLSKLPAAMGQTTIEYKVNLVRPITKDTGEVVTIAEVTYFGRTTAVSEAKLTTVDGKLLALGMETCAIFPFDPKQFG